MSDRSPENDPVESNAWAASPPRTERSSSLSRLLGNWGRGARWSRPQKNLILDDFRYRLDAMLIPPATTERTLGEIHQRHDWVGAWNRTAQRFLAESRRDNAHGDWSRAATARRNAAMCYHVANLLSEDDPRTIRTLRASSVQAFSQAIPQLLFETRKIRIPWRTLELQGYLCKPEDAPRPMPLVCILNGATTTKEETLLWTASLRRAGFAVLTLDWPGTGEAAGALKLSSQCDDISDGIYALAARDLDLDAEHLALMGISIGSSVALRAAALDRRISAVIAVSPPFEPHFWTANVPMNEARFLVPLAGQAASLPFVLQDFGVSDLLHRVKCPVLIIGAGQDRSIPSSESLHIASSLGDLATLVWYEHATHCAFEQIDDWMDVATQWLFGAFGFEIVTPASELEPSTQVESATSAEETASGEDVVISVDPAAMQHERQLGEPEDDEPTMPDWPPEEEP